MRHIPEPLAAHIASEATTLARCWRVARRDGVVRGFTDHDRALVLDGLSYEPGAGLSVTDIPSSVGLSVDTAEVSGALVSPTITDADIAAGLYDMARIELRIVNWRDPSQHVLIEAGDIGEITREGDAFRAEVRGLTHRLDQERGRIYAATCDADLGDARCGVDLTAPTRSATATVTAVLSPRSLRVSGAGALLAGDATRGDVRFQTGANAGVRTEIRLDYDDHAGRALDLWDTPSRPIAVGDTLTVTVGCDKRLATCHRRFANSANFRGFPHLPGNDFAMSYARTGSAGAGEPVA